MSLLQAQSRCMHLVLSKRGMSLRRLLPFCSQEARRSKHRAAFSALAAVDGRLHVGAGHVPRKVSLSHRCGLHSSVRVALPKGEKKSYPTSFDFMLRWLSELDQCVPSSLSETSSIVEVTHFSSMGALGTATSWKHTYNCCRWCSRLPEL